MNVIRTIDMILRVTNLHDITSLIILFVVMDEITKI